jgi:hypothetical protein
MRRLRSMLKSAGVFDGLWTAATSAGSKLQTLAAISCAGYMHGTQAVGDLILAISISFLCVAVVDMGLGSQVTRAYARGIVSDKRDCLRPLLKRSAIYPAAAAAFVWPLFRHHEPREQLAWLAVVSLYAVGYQWSSTFTHVAYGCGQFRSSSTLTGLVRLGTVPIFALIVVVGIKEPFLILLPIAFAEFCIACVRYRLLTGAASGERVHAASALSIRETYKFGIGPVCNMLVNRSDTVLIAAVSATAVATYGLASQIENALTTAALIPAAALVTYSARAAKTADSLATCVRVSMVVAGVYIVISLPFLIWPAGMTSTIFHTDLAQNWPLRLCVIAGLFSCVAGAGMAHLIGLGKSALVASIWISVTVVALLGLTAGASVAGALGGAIGALIRDIVFCALVWLLILRAHSTAGKSVVNADGFTDASQNR